MKLQLIFEIENVEWDLLETLEYKKDPDNWEPGVYATQEELQSLTQSDLFELIDEMEDNCSYLSDTCVFENLTQVKVIYDE